MATFDPKSIKKIGVYTSGGDAPGMNASIRAVTRTALHKGLLVDGIVQGYQGMMDSQFQDLHAGSVANIIQRGGTFLKSGRCLDFLEAEARAQAAKNLKARNIDALVCIGGDGSFRGAHELWKEHQIPIVGVPGTIDNDISGTDYTIGFDTAVNTALDAIDRIRDTAASHDRLFIVEVMGRNSGYIAAEAGLAGGAEGVITPENPFNSQSAIEHIQRGIQRGKKSSILITAEGDKPGQAYEIAEEIKNIAGYDAKVCILGHIQRGGKPLALDRLLASRFGAKAVEALLTGHCDCMVALKEMTYDFVDLSKATQKKVFKYQELLDLVDVLSQ